MAQRPFAPCHFTIIGVEGHRGFALSPYLLGEEWDNHYQPERQRIREDESPAGFNPANPRPAISNSGSLEENLVRTNQASTSAHATRLASP